jgi:hypothetical protein
MTTNPVTRFAVAALSVMAVLLIAAPFASAQTSSKFSVKDTTIDLDQIKPDVEKGELTVNWNWQLDSAPQNAVIPLTGAFIIEWTYTCDNPNILITGSFSELVTVSAPTGATQATATGPSKFTVTVNQDAPGETQVGCEITGTPGALSTQGATAAAASSGKFTVAADYLGLISVNVPKTIKQAGPQKEITYDIEISNLGNARSNIDFALDGETASGWRPVVPGRITLHSLAQGGTETSKTVGFTISTPFKNGWNNKDTTFVLKVTPSSTKDDSPEGQGSPVTMTMLARVRGVYVPSLEPMIMLGALLGAALVVRLAKPKDE